MKKTVKLSRSRTIKRDFLTISFKNDKGNTIYFESQEYTKEYFEGDSVKVLYYPMNNSSVKIIPKSHYLWYVDSFQMF